MTFTLGWELEANRRAATVPDAVESGGDGSVSGDAMEYKIRSQHVLNPNLVLESLKSLVADTALRVDRSCGFHVHVGLGKATPLARVWASWMVTMARSVEEVAFQAVPESRRSNRYCRRYGGSNMATSSVQTRQYWADKYSNADMRYYWVNVVEMFRPSGIKTVEIRLLGNTRRFSYLLGWISAVQVMASSAWKLTMDPSAMFMETETVKSAFEKIRVGILPNSDAAQCVATANELAMRAGFIVRANANSGSVATPTSAPVTPRTPVQTETTPPYMARRLSDLRNEIASLGSTPYARINNITDQHYLDILERQLASARSANVRAIQAAAMTANQNSETTRRLSCVD